MQLENYLCYLRMSGMLFFELFQDAIITELLFGSYLKVLSRTVISKDAIVNDL